MNSQVTNGDIIENLPTDATMPSGDELQIINSIFRENKISKGKLFDEAKESVIIIILFTVLSIEPVDNLLKKFISAAKSPYILILIKAVIFAVVFYAIKNMYLVKNK
jgi:hypothetical protein